MVDLKGTKADMLFRPENEILSKILQFQTYKKRR